MVWVNLRCAITPPPPPPEALQILCFYVKIGDLEMKDKVGLIVLLYLRAVFSSKTTVFCSSRFYCF